MDREQLQIIGRMRELARTGAARSLREQHHWTIRELALVIEHAPSSVARWEAGLSRPRADAALRWAEALGVAS